MSRKIFNRTLYITTTVFTVIFMIISMMLFQLIRQGNKDVISHFPESMGTNLSYEKQASIVNGIGIWMNITIIFVVIIVVIISVLLRKSERIRPLTILLVTIGLIILLGTQGLGSPFSLVYFILAGFCFFKPDKIRGGI